MGQTADVVLALCPPQIQLHFPRGGERAKLAAEVALRSIDGKTTLKALYHKVDRSLGSVGSLSKDEFYQSMEILFTQLHSLGMLHLQLAVVAPSINPAIAVSLR